MNPIVESSVAVRTIRWLARDSVVASAVRASLRPFARIDQAFARAAAEKDARIDHDRLAAVLKSSRIVRFVDAIFSAPFAAWESARVRPIVDDVRGQWAAMSTSERIRLLGWMLAVGVITRSTLYVLSGAALTRATLAVWGVVLMVALVMMTASRQVAAGWHEWKARKR